MESLKDFAAVAAIATAFATVTSSGLALLWRAIDQKRAAWVIHKVSTQWHEPDHAWTEGANPKLRAVLANVGDGLALGVKIQGHGCDLMAKRSADKWNETSELFSALHPGDEMEVSLRAAPSDWERAEVVISWTPSPSPRGKRKVERLRVSSLAPLPEYRSRYRQNEQTGEDEREVVEPPSAAVLAPVKSQLTLAGGRVACWRQTRRLRAPL